MSRAKKMLDLKPSKPTVNREAYPAYNRSVEEEYVQLLLTNTFANTFYADSQELINEAHSMHELMLELHPEFMARALVYARDKGFMRLQPLYGLALLSAAQPTLFAQTFPHVVKIPSDLADFMTILRGQGRGQGGRAVKRQVAAFLSSMSEYWALKYNGRGRGFSLGDAVATAHPKPHNAQQQALYRYVRGHETDLTNLPQLEALEQLKRSQNDQERIYWIRQGKLPYETVTSVLQPSAEVWEELMKQMPVFALLRHLNTLERQGVFGGRVQEGKLELKASGKRVWNPKTYVTKVKKQNLNYIAERLTDTEALSKSRILPFRFVKAFHEVENEALRKPLEQAVELTFANLPDLPGRTAIFLDISGSMVGEYLQTGSVFALALYKKTNGNSLFWLFDTFVQDAKPSRHESIMSQAARIHARGGTNTGAPLRKLIHDEEVVDQIIMITDEQQNHGSQFYKELQTYRHQINRNAKAFIIDIAPYRNAMVPPEDMRTFYIYGWSDLVLSFISRAVKGYSGMVQHIEQLQLDAAEHA